MNNIPFKWYLTLVLVVLGVQLTFAPPAHTQEKTLSLTPIFILLLLDGDDHGDNAVTATLIGVPSSTPGNIEEGTDTDWFSFNANSGTDYEFETVLGTLPDSKLRLINTDGVTLIQENDDFGGTLASKIIWTASASGTYFLEVLPFSTSQTGTYSLVTRSP